MLLELRLRNVAVIESVTLPLAEGLNVLTGETGAGKSLIVGALGLLLGERAAADRIRRGQDRAVVEATFDSTRVTGLRTWLEEHGIEYEDCLILKREVSATGRSRAWVNGSPVTATLLREIGSQLVAIHGQHEAQQLLEPAAQRATLDAYADAADITTQVSRAHALVLSTRQELEAFEERRRTVGQRADYLRFLVQEIDSASVRDGDDVAIEAEHRRLAHAEELRMLSSQISDLLRGDDHSVLSRLDAVRRNLNALQRIDPQLEKLQSAFDSAYIMLDDLGQELERYSEEIDADAERLKELESRRSLIYSLTRKYGPTLRDVLNTAQQAREELALVDDASHAKEQLESALNEAVEARREAAARLTELRKHAAEQISVAVSSLLPELGMPMGQFSVKLHTLEEIGAFGAESVSFLVALNAGSQGGTLDRVASGGELARVMLALSTVLARLQQIPTLVFDEVDAGVGGTVAWQVGALMRRVAEHHQVLAISHLAQIAACAHHQVVVRKDAAGNPDGGLTTADTSTVTGEERVVELARMLGGDADREISRAHARELLGRGQSLDLTQRAPASTRRQRKSR